MERIEYRVRPVLWSKEQHWVLTDDALSLSEAPLRDGQPVSRAQSYRLPLSAIHRLRLIYAPGRYESDRFECEILGECEGRPFKRRVASHHVRGLADFVHQGPSYAPFVRALCQRAAAQNPGLRVLSGYSPLSYYLGLAVLLVVIAGFSAFVFFEWERLWRLPRTPGRLFMLSVLLAFLFLIYRRNRPRVLSPDALPDELLPKTPISKS
ncbi:MAG TPA: hypothetical protein PKI03_26475 [Pseudomonadota bacterium]|nr:hypothetical protein [Pseudomonadota bacterium]